MKRKKIKVLLLLTMLLMNTLMYSQGPGNNGNGPPFPCPPHNPVCGGQPGLPIDNGLPILLLVGAIFGVYKIYSNKHKILKRPI